MNLNSLIDNAYMDAKNKSDEGLSLQVIHRNRSKNFVETLADQFENNYTGTKTVRVLSKHNYTNRPEFGLNELLFDILVCDTASVLSARAGKPLTYINRVYWSIESEFARDTQQAMFDFNKLVLSTAESKLFVGPLVNDEHTFLRPLSAPAKYCMGNVYVALVPHPDEWPSPKKSVHLYKFAESDWHLVGNEGA